MTGKIVDFNIKSKELDAKKEEETQEALREIRDDAAKEIERIAERVRAGELTCVAVTSVGKDVVPDPMIVADFSSQDPYRLSIMCGITKDLINSYCEDDLLQYIESRGE